jgi:hypothetical protein
LAELAPKAWLITIGTLKSATIEVSEAQKAAREFRPEVGKSIILDSALGSTNIRLRPADITEFL